MDDLREYLGYSESEGEPSIVEGSKVKEIIEEIKLKKTEQESKIYFLTGYDLKELRRETLSFYSEISKEGFKVLFVREPNKNWLRDNKVENAVYLLWEDRFKQNQETKEFVRDLFNGKYSRLLAGSIFLVSLTVEKYGPIFNEKESKNLENYEDETDDEGDLSLLWRIGFFLLGLSFMSWAITFLGLGFDIKSITYDITTEALQLFIILPLSFTISGIILLAIGLRSVKDRSTRLTKISMVTFLAANIVGIAFIFITNGYAVTEYSANRSAELVQAIIEGIINTVYLSVYSLILIPFANLKRRVLLIPALLTNYLSLYYLIRFNPYPTWISTGVNVPVGVVNTFNPVYIFNPFFGINGIYVSNFMPGLMVFHGLLSALSNGIFAALYFWVSIRKNAE